MIYHDQCIVLVPNVLTTDKAASLFNAIMYLNGGLLPTRQWGTSQICLRRRGCSGARRRRRCAAWVRAGPGSYGGLPGCLSTGSSCVKGRAARCSRLLPRHSQLPPHECKCSRMPDIGALKIGQLVAHCCTPPSGARYLQTHGHAKRWRCCYRTRKGPGQH